MTVAGASNFFEKHEKLIIVLVLLVAITVGFSHVTDWLDRRADKANNVAQAALLEQVEANKKLAAAAEEAVERYKELADRLTAENKSLRTSQVQRQVVTQQQQATDRTLPPDQLAKRWVSLVPAISEVETVIPTENGYQVTTLAAVETVVLLETIPTLQQDLKDDEKIIANKDEQIAGLETVNLTAAEQLEGLKAEIVKQDTACKTQVDLVKADARKSKLRYLKIGTILGTIAGVVVRGMVGF